MGRWDGVGVERGGGRGGDRLKLRRELSAGRERVGRRAEGGRRRWEAEEKARGAEE